MVELWLPYGNSEIPVRVPEERLLDILKPRHSDSQLDVAPETKRLVESNSELLDQARKAKRICLALGPTSNKRLMFEIANSLIQSLTNSGVQTDALTVLLTPDAQEGRIDVLPESQIIRHSSASSTLAIENFRGEFVPKLNSTFVEAELKVVICEVKPHHFLGYTGAADVIFPGLGASDSIESHLSNREGLDITAIYHERMKLAKSIPNAIAFGFVLGADLNPARLSLGTVPACMDDLKDVSKKLCSTQVEKTADIVVISAGGLPMDETLLRAVETFPSGLTVAGRDGVLIVAAECSKGHGDTAFYEWCTEKKEPRYLESRLRHKFNYAGWKAAFLLRALEAHRIYLISTIPDHYVEDVFGIRAAKTVNSALQTVERSLGSDSKVTVIPDASHLIPNVSGPSQVKT
jgi:nickel-dependent lactate racemase